VLIARIEAVAARRAVIVGAFQSQGAQHAYEVLGPACDITRFNPTKTTKACTGFIGKVGVETLLNGVGREPQSTLAQSDFQSLEIQLREGFPT
jgi:glycyl-tRNA synthetase beta subunit